ncbi:sorting nexin-1-like [Pyxicephalus adspersus]|uniref:sorting nexin-1-like n=1 Tax=Pyxicephalus adspersus TaxID=30357 RepID=UPI003B5B8C75
MADESGASQRDPPELDEDEEAPGTDSDTEGEDIFTGASKPVIAPEPKKETPQATSRENGLFVDDDDQDIFAESTVKLSVDSSHSSQKEESPLTTPMLIAAASAPPKQKTYEELEEEEQEDQFELSICIRDPEKIGDGMNAYVAYQVSTQTNLPMFRSKNFTVKRRFSDFLGLYEKLSEKHSQNGFIVAPPPEKSLIGILLLLKFFPQQLRAYINKRWFEDKFQEVENEEQHLRKLHGVVETLVNHRKELAVNTAQFAKSLAMLGSSEDNTALSRALSQLAEVEEKIEQLHQEQANSDFYLLAELLADYIRLLSAVRGAFDQRMKTWQRWQDAQSTLQKKRENEARLLWANKPDKLQQAKDEISEWESRVTQYERDFERISVTVRKEVIRFEKEKSKDFKSHIVKYLETLLNSQHKLAKYWEAFLPEAKVIS